MSQLHRCPDCQLPMREVIKDYASDHVVCEVAYLCLKHGVMGYWCMGSFDPAYPYMGVDWVDKAPPTPLEELINGIKYPHLLICSGDSSKPLGSSGCCCLNLLRRGK
jgi:hypothetical protein